MVQVSGTAAIVFGSNRPHDRQLLKSACEAQGWTKMVTRPPSRTAALNAAMRDTARTLLTTTDGLVSVRALDQDFAFEAIKVCRGNQRNTEIFLCSAQLSAESVADGHEVQILASHPDVDAVDTQSKLQSAYDGNRNHLSASQVLSVVAAAVRQIGGVALGGPNVYYVPHHSVPTWNAWRDAAQLWNYHSCPLEVAASPETVEHIISQLEVEVREGGDEVLAAVAAGDLHPRTAKALAKRARGLVEKIKSYENALGQQLDWMRGPLENAEAALGLSTLLAASV